MLSQKFRKTLTSLHRWAGVSIALLLLGQGCSGMMVAFKDELAHAVDPAMRSAPATLAAPRISADQAFDAALSVAPQCRPRRLYFPKYDDGVFLLKCEQAARGQDWIITIDSRQARVLAAGPVWRFPLEFADEWHLEMRFARPGRAIVGWLGSSLALLAIAGLIVWWPGVKHLLRAMRPAWRGGLRRKLLVLHRLIGPVAFPLILLLSLAGLLTAWRPWVDPLVGKVLPLASAPAFPAAETDRGLLPLAQVERLALAAFPGASVRDIRERNGNYATVQVVLNPFEEARPRAADHAWIDRRTGELIGTQSTAGEPAGSRVLGWLLPIHTGEWLGLPGRILMLLTGVAILVLTVTGVISTFKKSA